MKKRLTSAISVVIILTMMITMLTSCGGGNKSEANTIHTVTYQEPGSLDPALSRGTHESLILNHLFTGLLSYNSKGDLSPGMAELPDVSEDGLTYTFHLKDDMKWSNGDPVTANDFKYEWLRVLTPETGAEYSYQFYYIQGAEELNTLEAPGTYYVKDSNGKDTKEIDHKVEYTDSDTEGLNIEGKSKEEISKMVYDKWLSEKKEKVAIEAPDDKTLVVKLNNPVPYFAELTANYAFYPINSKIAKKNPDWAKSASDDYTCNGAFTLENWDHDNCITLAKNDSWVDAKDVKIDGIIFDILEDHNTAWQNYESGQYQFLSGAPQEVVAEKTKDNDKELHFGGELGTYYYALNMESGDNDKAIFSNKKIRQALSMSLDRDAIVKNVAKGGQYPATGLVCYGIKDDQGKDFRDPEDNLLKYEPKKAKELLKEGLKEEGLKLSDMNDAVLMYNTDENHKKLAQTLQQMWKQNLGIEIALENCDLNVKMDREDNHDFDISRAGWVGDYNDPMTFMDISVTDGPMNFSGYSNAEYDSLIETAKTANDQTERMNAMKKAERILMDDMPLIPLYFYTQPYFVKPNVKGIYKPLTSQPILTYAIIEDDK